VLPGEDFRDLLDRRGVDVFFGVGIPPTRAGRRYTSAHLEASPGWLLVSRSIRHGIYLRRSERNREKLRRVTAWYARQGVPFDPERGLDVEAVLRERSDWAADHGMLLGGRSDWLRERRDPDPQRRFRALVGLGRSLALVGVYPAAVELAREAVALRPDAPGPRRQLVYALLRLGRTDEALAAARALHALAPDDPRARACLATARTLARREPGASPPADALIDRLTL
jgi:tetratricopeptide (TPR) repeat protein